MQLKIPSGIFNCFRFTNPCVHLIIFIGNPSTPYHHSYSYSEKSDVYSFGMMCYELSSGKTPFCDIQSFKVPEAVCSGQRPTIPSACDGRLVALITTCWAQDPENRPTFESIEKQLSEMMNKEYAYGKNRAERLKL